MSLRLFVKDQLIQEMHFEENEKHYVSFIENSKVRFYEIHNQQFIENMVMFYSQHVNRVIMANNQLERCIAVNSSGFGADIVYKNFNDFQPISV